MEDKTIILCSSCGQEIKTAGVQYAGRIYCDTCRPAREEEETIAAGTDAPEKTRDLTMTQAGQPQTVALEQTQAAETAAGSAAKASGTSRVLTMGRSVPATRIIREVLKIEPTVDLENSSSLYYSLKGETGGQQTSSSSVQQLISHAGEETKYIFDRELGRGGMGAVFETVDLDVRRKVAMKVMLPSAKTNTSQVKRFLEEAQINGQLEHPNIVPVHEIGIDDNHTTYFTMKLVRGENLDAVIAHLAAGDKDYQKKYSLGTLVQIFMKICDGIGYAHSRGVLHRDLKPENIMIGDFGEVLVMDWGLAKVLGQESSAASEAAPAADETASGYRTMEGQVMGTPSYMSPEQASGRISELDQRSDIFSLGGILYKILTYQPPYQGATAREILEKARKRQLVPPDVRAPQQAQSPELNAVCMKAMARNPEERYAGALELKNDLQLYLDGKSVSAKKDSLLIRTRKWVLRNRVLSMGIVAAVVCLAAGITFTRVYEQQKRQSTITGLLSAAEQAQQSGQYEKSEEIFFSVLGLDNNNEQARRGIALVSGKALSLKNKRLAKDKLKEAQTFFAGGDYLKAYDAYVATFALDPDSADARTGMQGAAVKAEKQKALVKIAPLLSGARQLEREKAEADKSLSLLKAETKKIKNRIKGYEEAAAKKPLWDAEKAVLAKQMDKLKLEGRIISFYSTILSYDGENPEARKALAAIYYNKFTEAEALQNRDDMAYFKELLLSFDDGQYKTLLEREGMLTLTTIPPADAYFIYRFVEGPDQRMIPAPFSPAAYFSGSADTGETARGIEPGAKLSAAAFLPYEKLLQTSAFNRLQQIEKLRLPTGSYLVLITRKGCITTRLPVNIGRGDAKVLENISLVRTAEAPDGFVYVPAGEFIMGGDARAPYSLERNIKFVPGFLVSQHEVTAGEYLKFINFIEARLPGSAEKYLPRKSATAGFYWKKSGSQYRSDFPDDWPVLGISWNDAKAYCRWMTLQNQDKGWEFRLPEDWEWEKAARGVDGRYYPWGNNFDYRFCSMAYSREGKRDGPDPVGSFPLDESVYGVKDIAGNVAEWCETYFDPEQNIRINRGAAWSYVDDDYARCAERNGHGPADVADFRGFRMVLSQKK